MSVDPFFVSDYGHGSMTPRYGYGDSCILSQPNAVSLFFFFSARLLQMTKNSRQWNKVYNGLIRGDQAWAPNDVVALIQWVPDLTRTLMPVIIREGLETNSTAYATQAERLDETVADEQEWAKLAMWSDLFIYDYLTGNYDRVSSMQVRKLKLKIKIKTRLLKKYFQYTRSVGLEFVFILWSAIIACTSVRSLADI